MPTRKSSQALNDLHPNTSLKPAKNPLRHNTSSPNHSRSLSQSSDISQSSPLYRSPNSSAILPPNWKELLVKLEGTENIQHVKKEKRVNEKRGGKERLVPGVDFEYPVILPPSSSKIGPKCPDCSSSISVTSKRKESKADDVSGEDDVGDVKVKKRKAQPVLKARRRSSRIAKVESKDSLTPSGDPTESSTTAVDRNEAGVENESSRSSTPSSKSRKRRRRSSRVIQAQTGEQGSTQKSQNDHVKKEEPGEEMNVKVEEELASTTPVKTRRRSTRLSTKDPAQELANETPPSDLQSNILDATILLTPLPKRKRTKRNSLKSPYFKSPPKASKLIKGQAFARPPPTSETFGLIQESINHNLYQLCIQAILWNQTTGRAARPVLSILISKYPTPTELAEADFQELADILHPIGLFNIRARRLIDFAKIWCEMPPSSETGSIRKGYPTTPSTSSYPRRKSTPDPYESDSKLLSKGKSRSKKVERCDEPFEICHLPGMGPYALDSYRIFHRDELRGLARDWKGTGATTEDYEPEWKRVLPLDKELRPFLKWMWRKEGWDWDDLSGKRTWVGVPSAGESEEA